MALWDDPGYPPLGLGGPGGTLEEDPKPRRATKPGSVTCSEGRAVVKWYSRYRAFSVLLQGLLPYTSYPMYPPLGPRHPEGTLRECPGLRRATKPGSVTCSEGRSIVRWYSSYRAFSVLLQRLIPYTNHPMHPP
jgi:membrane protein DedA with SNARE-associated domain